MHGRDGHRVIYLFWPVEWELKSLASLKSKVGGGFSPTCPPLGPEIDRVVFVWLFPSEETPVNLVIMN